MPTHLERPWLTWRLFGELLHAEAVLEGEAIRIVEIQKDALRREMATGPEDDWDTCGAESVDRAADVVHGFHHEVHMMQLIERRLLNRERVMEDVRKAAQPCSKPGYLV